MSSGSFKNSTCKLFAYKSFRRLFHCVCVCLSVCLSAHARARVCVCVYQNPPYEATQG